MNASAHAPQGSAPSPVAATPSKVRQAGRKARPVRAWHRLRCRIGGLRRATPAIRHHLIGAALVMLAGTGWVAPAEAVPITYTESAIASGTLGATAFTDALVTVTLTADTGGVAALSISGINALINPGAATLSIAGLGTATFNSPNGYTAALIQAPALPYFTSTGFVIAQFDDPAHVGFTGILGLDDPALAGYGLQNPFGPLTGKGIGGSGSESFSTSRGLLFMTSGAEITTFTATVPEPSSVAMFALGAAALLAALRHRPI